RAEQDSAWKEMIDEHFEKFIAFFFPDIHAEIDWSRNYVFPDKELAKLGRGHAQGLKLADKLAKVWLKDGNELWVLIHTEVQGQAAEDFNQRVYVYNYKIVDRFGAEVVSLAVVTGRVGETRLGRYETGRWGCRLLFEFPVVKIEDWRGREAELLASDNPFALVVLAYLRVSEAKGDTARRYEVKRELIRLAYEQGYEHKQILSLLRFIDWMIILPEDLEDRLDDDIQEFEEGKKMPYVTSWERRAEKRGLERGEKRGRKEGRIDVVLLLLEQRLGEIEVSMRRLVEKLTVKRLDDLAVALLDFTEASDLERWLKRNNGKRRSVKVKK
ncbi:MAG: DUF4351 domain-containing protein, partial [Acidobacteria bacterium]|nr:DUF4351 domain-containing protein [Acidobacteriota bacterium]